MDRVARALVGTDQSGPTAAGGAPRTAPEGMVDGLATLSVEARLLLEAGATAIVRAAGERAPAPSATPPRCPPEELRPCPAGVASILRETLLGAQHELLPLAVAEMRHGGFALPPELLPVALASPKAQRRLLAPVLGTRGRWLATLNPEWSWAAQGATSGDEPPPVDALRIFQEGSLDERREVLGQVRRRDPASARVWLAEVWGQEKAEVRRALLQVLEEQLGPEDEVFLEQALGDRSALVRRRAAELLRGVPGSALGARMAARTAGLLALRTPDIALKLRAAVAGHAPTGDLVVTLPRGFDPEWARDGIAEAAPGGLGRGAWWLSQLLAATPLGVWTGRLGEDPRELVRALRGSDLAAPVLDGWTAAALRQRATAWMPPLWDLWRRIGAKGTLTPRPQAALLAAMDPADAEARICDLLGDGTLIVELMEALPRPWPSAVATIYLSGLDRWLDRLSKRRPQNDDPWLSSLRTAGVALPSALLSRARQLPPPANAPNNWYGGKWRRAFAVFIEALDLRRRLAEEMRAQATLSSTSPPTPRPTKDIHDL